MKKFLFTSVISLFVIFTISAQKTDKFTGSLLWKVSGKNLNEPSYILGTHHLATISFAESITGLRNAIYDVRQIAGELDLRDKMNLQRKLNQSAMMPGDQSYQDLLSSDDYKTLDDKLKKLFGVGLNQMGIVKPGIISINLAFMAFSKSHPNIDITKHISIDEYLQNLANEQNKSVIGLETVEDQINALLESEPIKTQAEQLVCNITNFEYFVESLKELTSNYMNGRLAEMYDLSFNNPNDPCPSSEKLQNELIRKRNDKWLEKIPQIIKEKPTLIVVGALHLAGEEGLLFQLDKLGYKIEKVE